MRVLVTGGAGYIGSVCAEELLRQGHEVVVIDDLSTGRRKAVPDGAEFYKYHIADPSVMRLMKNGKPFDVVFHFAARALVGESMDDPSDYYYNNLQASMYLIEMVREAGIERFVFSSSCAVYGITVVPITEEGHKEPANPYGETKLAFERLLQWYAKAYKLSVCSFRYFNAAGATKTHGEDHKPETHIIPLLLEVAAGERESFTINGAYYPTVDGTCVRDYVHVLDIAHAHILALQNLDSPGFSVYNIGTGVGFSVYEVLTLVRDITERPIPFKYGPRRDGDPAILYASPKKLMSELGWKPQYSSLDNIIETAWKWKMRNK